MAPLSCKETTRKRKKKKRKKSELYGSLVCFTVQQSTQGKQPELNSLNSSDILRLSGAGNALCASGEGITDKREVSSTAGGRVTPSGPRGDGAEASSVLPL